MSKQSGKNIPKDGTPGQKEGLESGELVQESGTGNDRDSGNRIEHSDGSGEGDAPTTDKW